MDCPTAIKRGLSSFSGYSDIPIPGELDQVIWNATQQAERDARSQKLHRWLVSTAAVFCAVFLSANITPVYAYASQLPVIGAVVRVLHIGTGGEITDGAHTGASVEGETVDFHFESYSEELDAVPAYSVSHLLAPNRMILTLHSVRTIDCEAIEQSLLSTEAVRSVSRAMIGNVEEIVHDHKPQLLNCLILYRVGSETTD